MLHDIAKNIGGDLNEPDSRGITSLHYILKMPLSVHEKTPFFDIPGVDMVGDIRVQSNFLSAVLDQQKSASVVSYGVLERLVQANINSVNAYGLTTLMHLVVKVSLGILWSCILICILVVFVRHKQRVLESN
jgi:hypothetical protein